MCVCVFIPKAGKLKTQTRARSILAALSRHPTGLHSCLNSEIRCHRVGLPPSSTPRYQKKSHYRCNFRVVRSRRYCRCCCSLAAVAACLLLLLLPLLTAAVVAVAAFAAAHHHHGASLYSQSYEPLLCQRATTVRWPLFAVAPT